MLGGTMLEVEDDNNIQSREENHAVGLRQREVHVWLIAPDNEIIFQRRSPTAIDGNFCRNIDE